MSDHDHDEHSHDEHSHEEHGHDDHDHEGHGEEHEHHHTFDWKTEVEAMREEAAHFYVDHFDWKGQQPPAGFTGPKYFDLDEDWRLLARLDREAEGAGDPVTLATSTGLLRQMQHHRTVLAHRVQHHRVRSLGHNLAQDVNTLRLKAVEMSQR